MLIILTGIPPSVRAEIENTTAFREAPCNTISADDFYERIFAGYSHSML